MEFSQSDNCYVYIYNNFCLFITMWFIVNLEAMICVISVKTTRTNLACIEKDIIIVRNLTSKGWFIMKVSWNTKMTCSQHILKLNLLKEEQVASK